ncbi:MAG: hypothetical protein ACLQQ4_03575 [Bacteroidia bacterium]
MIVKKYLILAVIAGLTIFTACNSAKRPDSADGGDQAPVAGQKDTVVGVQKVAMVINNIPFPAEILDTLHFIHINYQGNLTNPVDNITHYSESNSQAVNIGIYGADLAYVITFEQFQLVGTYMKAAKTLAEDVGITVAFSEDVIGRCRKNSTNKDSLIHIVYDSYSIIDKTLKGDRRKATELMVLAGGWIEGTYLTTQSFQTLVSATDRQGAFNILMEEKKYLDELLNQLDLISDSPYCQDITTALHEIRGVFNNINDSSVSDETIKTLSDKVRNLRIRIVHGGNVW